MLSGISVFCFAASYAVALALEATRLWFKSGVRGALMLGFAAAGLLAHTLFLVYRAMSAEEAPLSSAFDWYLLAAWAVVAIYLYSIYYHPRASIGIFVLPVVLALVGMAQLSDREPFPQDPAAQVWGILHGALLLLGYVAVIVGFVAGVMYLLQAHWLKHKQPYARKLRLPSLEWLDRVNGRAMVLSAIFVCAGFVAGVILNVVNHRQQLDYVPWSDPIVWRAGGMMAWLVVAALFSRLYRPANHGRKVAYLTVASFVFLAITVVMRPIVASEHRAKEEAIQTRRQGDKETRGEAEQRFQANFLVSLSPPLLVLPRTDLAIPMEVTSTPEVAP